MTDIEQIMKIHESKCIINQNCYIFKPEVIDYIEEGSIVRISFIVDSYLDTWSHDSPYLKIIVIEDDLTLGQIIGMNRQNTDKYPFQVGDKIWFKKENIIELFTYPEDIVINSFLTINKVSATGPFFTIRRPYTDDESEYSDVSDSD